MSERVRLEDLSSPEIERRIFAAIRAADHSQATEPQRAAKWRFVGSAWAELVRRQNWRRWAARAAMRGGDADL